MPVRHLLCFLVILASLTATAQTMFAEQTGLLFGGDCFSGVAMAVVDMDGDGLDDIVRFNNAQILSIEPQLPTGGFNLPSYTNDLGSGIWSLAIADADFNGRRDIAAGGFSNTVYLSAGSPFLPLSFNTHALSPTISLLQGSNFAPISGGGNVEYFACDDNFLSQAYHVNSDGTMTYDPNLIAAYSTVPSDNSGNYASVWTDYDNDGDVDMYLSKCRINVNDRDDGRRLNQLWQNNGDGTYTDVAGAAGLLPRAQSWATDFADIDNDGDQDCFIVNHDFSSALYKNNGDGTFTDVTVAMGMENTLAGGSAGIQCNFEDFNNDGYVDLMVTHQYGIHLQIHLNDGGNSMNLLPSSDMITDVDRRGIQSAATGDLNNDGYVDFYAGYADGFNSPSSTPDGLFLNTLAGNNHLKISLSGVQSNADGIGAVIKVYDEAWGVQTREVRSGESYGIMNSLTQHFGLAGVVLIDSVVISWPTGLVERAINVAANQTLAVTEGQLLTLLPLTWETFTATPEPGKGVRLNWSTSREEGVRHFEIERRGSGDEWAVINRLDAINRPQENTYLAYDTSPPEGKTYYRIRQVDHDGRFSFSDVELVRLQAAFTVFPNPVSDYLYVSHPGNKRVQYHMETLAGTRVLSKVLESGGRLTLVGIPAGVYLVRSGGGVARVVVR